MIEDGPTYHVCEQAVCLHCGTNISRGRYIHDGTLTPWHHDDTGGGGWCRRWEAEPLLAAADFPSAAVVALPEPKEPQDNSPSSQLLRASNAKLRAQTGSAAGSVALPEEPQPKPIKHHFGHYADVHPGAMADCDDCAAAVEEPGPAEKRTE